MGCFVASLRLAPRNYAGTLAQMNTLTTARLLLRPFEAADIPAYAAIRAKPEVVRFLPGLGMRAAEAERVAAEAVPRFAAQWTGEPGYGPWAVIEKASGLLLGHGGLRFVPELGDTEILYMLDRPAWGKGYATEVAAAACGYAFGTLRLPYVMALTKPENYGSRRVLEKTGMIRQPDLIELQGLQAVRYVMRREDWRGPPPA